MSINTETASILKSSIIAGDINFVHELLPKFQNDGYMMNLMFVQAVVCGNKDITMLLLDRGAIVNQVNQHGLYPLHHATQHCHTEIMRILIDKGADVNVKSTVEEYTFPLSIAIRNNSLEAIKLLVDSGANVNERINSRKVTPLYHAVSVKNAELVKLLLANSADVDATNISGESALLLAVKQDLEDVVQMLVDAGANLNQNGPCYSALHCAVVNSRVNLVKILLKAGADVNVVSKLGVTPLKLAVTVSNLEIVKLLVDAKADVNTIPVLECAIVNAVKSENLSIVSTLIDAGADVNTKTDQKKITALHLAAMLNELALIEKLLSLGADVNALDCENKTPLQYAVMENEDGSHADAMVCLLRNNAILLELDDCEITATMFGVIFITVNMIRSKQEEKVENTKSSDSENVTTEGNEKIE